MLLYERLFERLLICLWIIFIINQSRFSQADNALRAALPMLRHNEQSMASILFYLGWANYKMENFVEAARFYKQCMAIRGQFQEQATKNLAVIRSEQKSEASEPSHCLRPRVARPAGPARVRIRKGPRYTRFRLKQAAPT